MKCFVILLQTGSRIGRKKSFFDLSKAAKGFSGRRVEVCAKEREKSKAGRKLGGEKKEDGNGPAHVTSAEKRQD